MALYRTQFTVDSAQQLGVSTLAKRFAYMLTWIWLHLLVENISNQQRPESLVEDAINKPWRPLTAGRLTVTEARATLRTTVLISVTISFFLDSYMPSVSLMVLIWLYNDLEGSGVGPWQRNGLNAAGLSCFGWGAVTVLLGGQMDQKTESLLRNWCALMAAVILTTVHAQDFADIDGDKARGRKTMPLLYGDNLSRWGLVSFVILWSLVCPIFWNISNELFKQSVLGVGLIISGLVMVQGGRETDEWVWKLWCLWATMLYLLPLFTDGGILDWE